GDVVSHDPKTKARRAAATAASTSALVASGTEPTASRVAGECTSIRRSLAGATHSPPTRSWSKVVIAIPSLNAAHPLCDAPSDLSVAAPGGRSELTLKPRREALRSNDAQTLGSTSHSHSCRLTRRLRWRQRRLAVDQPNLQSHGRETSDHSRVRDVLQLTDPAGEAAARGR